MSVCFQAYQSIQNHIAHHLLTLLALNASPEELQKAYDANASYQRPSEPLEKAIVNDMHEPERFKSYLGQEKYYHDFLVYFQQEINKSGWQRVLQEHLFAETELAEDMLARMFAGFLHPIIHLGFGIEFQQPAIIAEALAQAAVHDNWIASLFFGCERAAKESRSKDEPRKTIVQILEECRKDDKLSKAAHWDDGNKVRDGIIKRAPEEMIKYAMQYTVKEGELEEKTAEMINAVGTLAVFLLPHSIPYCSINITLTQINNSILHRRCATPTPSSQIRLLLYPLPKLEYLLLCLPVSLFLPVSSDSTPTSRMEDLDGYHNVRFARLSDSPRGRNYRLRAHEG